MDTDIVVIAHNIRSSHNVGALLRTCDGIGVSKLYITGYTPYPSKKNDSRLPHIANKVNSQIIKTALGAEISQEWEYDQDIEQVLKKLKNDGYALAVLEQSNSSVSIQKFATPNKIALLLGSEVNGVNMELLSKIPLHLEIPMIGNKESYNVVIATAMALYQFRFVQ